MKIKTNLAQPLLHLSGIFRGMLTLIIFTAVGSAGLNWASYSVLEEEVEVLQSRLDRLRKSERGAGGHHFDEAELLAVVERVAQQNRLLRSGSGRLPNLLHAIESAVPDESALRMLQYDARRKEFSMVAEAKTEDAGTFALLVRSLQEQPYFSEVRVSRQRQSGERTGLVQLELSLVESSL